MVGALLPADNLHGPRGHRRALPLPAVPGTPLERGTMHADLLIHNARILTQDPARPSATSLLVRDGRIFAVDAPDPG
jgi:hypothetical protein